MLPQMFIDVALLLVGVHHAAPIAVALAEFCEVGQKPHGRIADGEMHETGTYYDVSAAVSVTFRHHDEQPALF